MSFAQTIAAFYISQYHQIQAGGWAVAITIIMPYVLSVNTMFSMHYVGKLRTIGWALQLGGQFGWLLWMVVSQNFGFLLLNAFMWYVIIKNLLAWRKNPPSQG